MGVPGLSARLLPPGLIISRAEGMDCSGGAGGTSPPASLVAVPGCALRPLLPPVKLAKKFQEEPVRSTSRVLPVVWGEPSPPDEVVGGLLEVLVSLLGCRQRRRRRPSA